ncbi:MAG: hypothetical protein R3B72_44030 [Polyangiaceae bacterium]
MDESAGFAARYGSLVFLVAVGVIGLSVAHVLDRYREAEGAPEASSVPSTSAAVLPAAPPPPPPPLPGRARWLAVGGGADPVSNQVSIEQNLALAAEVLGPEGILLYAGGAGRSPVHELGPPPSEDLHRDLGAFFDPRDGRGARYRPTRLVPHGPAEVELFQRHLDEQLAGEGPPLLLVMVAHGEVGKTPADNFVPLWGGDGVTVKELAETLDRVESPRPLRAVVTTCFSGGFAELAFAGADPQAGPAAQDRCGLFAATWDREASGCDPNPDRRQQESYALHFFHALRHQDRSGKPLTSGLDLDGDGAISLLEAHTRVRIASRAFSVPTTTAERWLAEAAPATGPQKALPLPEERAVIAALGAKLDIDDEVAAEARQTTLTGRLEASDTRLMLAERDEEASFRALRIALLERWPVLDDPYHPAYAETLDRESAAIEAFLADSAEAEERAEVLDRIDGLRREVDALEVELAAVERLNRAYDTVARAERLHHRGGEAFATYQRLLACERWVPDLKP